MTTTHEVLVKVVSDIVAAIPAAPTV